MEKLLVVTRKHSVELTSLELGNEQVRYQAWISGFLFNAYTCDIITNDGRVTHRFTDEHRW